MNILSFLSQATTEANTAWNLVIIAFFAGILVSFTPCIYPMIPITAGILKAQASDSLWNNVFHAVAYVIGIALVYASLGYLSATTAIIFGSWLASPWFLAIVIGLFLYLAFSMFGFYELYTPQLFVNQDTIATRPSLLHTLFLGLISGTVASPCLTPALAILLGLVAKEANPMLGFTALFFFAVGMSALLIIIGIFASSLTMLPKAGDWMDDIKHLFGFLMIGSCIYFLMPFFSKTIIYAGYAALSASAAYSYFRYGTSYLAARILGSLALLAMLTSLVVAIRHSGILFFN